MGLIDIRDANCTKCRHHRGVDEVCEIGHPRKGGSKLMVVTSRPNSETFESMLKGQLTDAGINTNECYFTSAMKCRNFDVSIGRTDLKACAEYLHREVSELKPEWVLVMGNEPLQALTNHSGIMKYRGKVIDKGNYKVFPTISPAAVSRNPGQIASYMADLRQFSAQVHDIAATIQPPKIQIIDTAERFKKLKLAVSRADVISFDIETLRKPTEFHPEAKIVSLSGTLEIDGKLMVWGLPLYHPQSPFRRGWQKGVKQLTPLMAKVPKRIAQNGKFDCRYLQHFGETSIDLTFDTMLASHLLDENREKGLKPQGTSRLGVPAWGIDTKDLLTTPLPEVLEYNALDTFYAYHIWKILRRELQEQPRLLRIFKFITMPAANILINVEQHGAWVDRERLATNGKIARDMVAELDRQVMEFVPHPESPGSSVWAESNSPWPTSAKGKPLEVNFNPSNFARWFLFEHLGLPILRRGKEKADGSPGLPSMAEDVMLELAHHPVVETLLKRSMWNQLVKAFFNAYDELLDERDRIHTTFKIAGTVTGRLSSGKEDTEKFSSTAPIRGVNLQQVPRDPLVRGLFGAPPGYTFVEADFSQVELRIAAFLSRDRTMLSLYQQGEDIHAATASWVLGIPRSKVTKDDRKKAKAVNFGFVYGMGWRKFIYTAFTKYGVRFSEEEAKGIRAAFFDQFSGLQAWHARQRRLVGENRRVQNPIGRIRHLPDIDSPEEGVRAEAERQAINSPVQSFGSDLCMLSMIEIHRIFAKRGVASHTIGTVHDALLFEVKDEFVGQALPIIKSTMENLPLQKKFGCYMDVPIIADIKVGSHWGDARELSTDEVYSWSG
jgi:uracil-DNA glycosylase family 4